MPNVTDDHIMRSLPFILFRFMRIALIFPCLSHNISGVCLFVPMVIALCGNIGSNIVLRLPRAIIRL